jgi:hypothetical protein
MARAETPTWLSLDEWARFHGFDPLHFNGLRSDGHTLGNCDITWTQHRWQRGQVSREDIAEAIQEAEDDLRRLLGYNLLPDWDEDRIPVTRHWQPGLIQTTPIRADGFQETALFPRGEWLMGGERVATLLADGEIVVWPGGPTETYAANRLATLTATVAATLNPDEVRLYFEPDADLGIGEADPAWEIRPLESVDVTGTTLTITVRRELLMLPAFQEAPGDGVDEFKAQSADTNATFVTALDIARVYNDPQNQLQLEWVPDGDGSSGSCGACVACELRSQTGCILGVDRQAGILSFAPATWDPSSEIFTTERLAACRQPDRLLVRSYTGFTANDSRGANPNRARTMDKELARYVAILSAANLRGEPCGCEAAVSIQKYQEEMDANLGDKSFQIGFNDARNPLGMKVGQMQVWRRVKRRQRPNFAIGAISAR